jgi:ABC-2 type transport system ATP-binding protein
MADDLAVRTTELMKSYGGGTRVLDGVDLRVDRGSVFVLLGPNGAGKTTMVRILSTLVRADAGQATVAGFDVVIEQAQVRRSISLTGQYVAVDELQTGEENLRMMAALSGLTRATATRRAADLLEQFDLAEAGRRRVATYSGGMRRRLDLAVGLVGQPSVIFLDEPTTGLDPRSRMSTWAVIRSLAGSGVTVFLTTQYLEEADQLADRIAVLHAGRVVAEGSAVALKQQYAQLRLDLTASGPDAYEGLARSLGDRIVHSDRSRLLLGIPTDGTAVHVRHLLDEADPGRRDIATFEVHTATLDDVFLALTGHSARAAATTQLTKETAGV